MVHVSKYSPKKPYSLVFNYLAFLIVMTAFIFIAWGVKEITAPISVLEYKPVALDYANLLPYSLRTVLRMLIAVIFSLLFSFIYATLAAKNSKLEQILIPLLDILQSLPILGYISFTVTIFLALAPSEVLGAECAAIFAIFTSQVWNITFSLYNSLKSVPQDLQDVSVIFKMSKWRKFWQIDVPYAIPSLVWNIVVSMSSGWFFVVASEVITVGDNKITLPGIGSYIALAIQEKNIPAISYAVLAMTLVIILYDQLLLRPLVVWSDRFHYEMTPSNNVSTSWVLNIFQKSILIKKLLLPIARIANFLLYLPVLNHVAVIKSHDSKGDISIQKWLDYIWYIALALIVCLLTYSAYRFLHDVIGWHEVVKVFILGLITMSRVIVLITISSIIWVPIGIYIGLSPKMAGIVQPLVQFFAAFPANLLFPVTFIVITHYNLNPNIWLSPLMIMGAQWYILFNVIVGASALPNDLKDAVKILKVKGWSWWYKVMLPAIAPYFITGAITASGGAWNASIVAEVINFGDKKIVAVGLGSYIAEMTAKADFNNIVLGMGMMSLLVILLNRLFWQPLNEYSVNKFRF